MADVADLLGRLTRALAEPGPLARRLCDAYRDLAGVTGAAITVRYGTPERITLAVTGPAAATLEDLQDVVGEGPGHSAWRTGQIEVGTLPVRSTSRWSLFDEAAEDLVDSASIHAVPMCPSGEILGVATLYQVPRADQPLGLDRAQLQFLANALGEVLARDPTVVGEDGPWASRSQIHQATGMVVAQLHVSPEDALALLRAHAYANQAPLAEIAASVVGRRLTFPIS